MIETKEIYLVVWSDGYDYSVEKMFESKKLAEEYVRKSDEDGIYVEKNNMYTKNTELEEFTHYRFEVSKSKDGVVEFNQSTRVILNINESEEYGFYTGTTYGGKGIRVVAEFKIESEEDKKITKVKTITQGIFSHMDALHKEGLLVDGVVRSNDPEIVKHMRSCNSFREQGLEEISKLYNHED